MIVWQMLLQLWLMVLPFVMIDVIFVQMLLPMQHMLVRVDCFSSMVQCGHYTLF